MPDAVCGHTGPHFPKTSVKHSYLVPTCNYMATTGAKILLQILSPILLNVFINDQVVEPLLT